MSWILSVVLLLVLLLRRYTFWQRRGVVQYEFWKIWWTNVREFFGQPSMTQSHLRLYQDFWQERRYVGTYQLFFPKLCILDSELIKQIFIKDFDHFTDHTPFIPTDGDPVMENSLFSVRGEKWRHLRAIASPALTSSKMKFMFGLMQESAQQLIRYLDQKSEDLITLEMKDTFARLTNDIFATTHFGVVCDSLKERDNEMYILARRSVDFSSIWFKIRFILIQMMPFITRKLGLMVFDQGVIRLFKRHIKENMEYRRQNGVVRPDMIQMLMEVGHVEVPSETSQLTVKETPLTYEEVTALVMSFFGGGFDSTSSLLSFVAYELAVNPDIQEKLQKEIDVVWEESPEDVSYDRLMKMRYIDMVVAETLRKWSGGFFLDRCCVKPYTIPPKKPGEVAVHLRKGDSIWLSVHALHRNPNLYPDPDRFDPERFGDESKTKMNPSYVPFGLGPRHCIGNRFALLEIKLVLFKLLTKYSCVPVEKTPIPLRLNRNYFSLGAEGGFWVGLKRR